MKEHPYSPDYAICYCDRDGIETERRITIARINGKLISEYCQLRHERRFFYMSRVTKWTNCNTGEIVSDILEDLNTARKTSVMGAIDRMTEDLYPVMGVLLYLGKRDNRFMIHERNILINAFRTVCDDQRLTDDLINQGINDMFVPSRTKYKMLVKELVQMDP